MKSLLLTEIMFTTVNGIDIYYEKSGEGKPLVLLHGNGEDHSRFDKIAAELSGEYAVYVTDTRYHGQSTKTETISYLEMMEDTAAFINKLCLEKPVVLGASDGGITGLLLAMKYPDLLSGLIACGANTHPSQIMKWYTFLMKISYLISRDKKIKMMLTEPDITNEDLASVKIPVLILAGSFDILPTPATLEIAAAIPNSEVKILKGQTHSSYLKNYKILITVIQPFLNRILDI